MSNQRKEADRIVVGVDESASSKEALRWSIRQAELTHSVVDAVTAWQFPPYAGSLGWMPPPRDFHPEAYADKVLTDAVEEVAGQNPRVEVRTTVTHGTAPDVLLHAAQGASLLVLGSRGHEGFTRALLGSVSQHCAQHAACPVVIMRDPVQ